MMRGAELPPFRPGMTQPEIEVSVTIRAFGPIPEPNADAAFPPITVIQTETPAVSTIP
jgi:hypothetical protein